jgi:hypothetical protein
MKLNNCILLKCDYKTDKKHNPLFFLKKSTTDLALLLTSNVSFYDARNLL